MDALQDALEESESDKSATPTSEIFGPGSPLDSIAVVSLIIDVEQRLNESLGIRVSLTDEHALSQSKSPFRTVTTLVDYILERATDRS